MCYVRDPVKPSFRMPIFFLSIATDSVQVFGIVVYLPVQVLEVIHEYLAYITFIHLAGVGGDSRPGQHMSFDTPARTKWQQSRPRGDETWLH